MAKGNRSKGVTFAEILISLLILGTAGVALLGMFFSGYGQIDKAETHRRALVLAEECMAFARASLTIDDKGSSFCGQPLTLPVQFRSPISDPVYLAVGFPDLPDGFAYTIDVEEGDQNGSSSDGEEMLIQPTDATLAASLKKLVRKITVTILFQGNRSLRLRSFVVNTHDY